MKKTLIAVHALVLAFIIIILISPTRFTFLAWNIFLALIAYELAILIYWSGKHYKWLSWSLSIIWLIFYPNTIYMITDFSHLSAIGTELLTTTQILNYSLLATGIFFGVTMGISSARIAIQTLFPKSNTFSKFIVFSFISALSSYAIYVGRYLRLNSWDLVLDFKNVLIDMHAAMSTHAIHFILIFTCLQIFLMLIFMIFAPNTKQNEQLTD